MKSITTVRLVIVTCTVLILDKDSSLFDSLVVTLDPSSLFLKHYLKISDFCASPLLLIAIVSNSFQSREKINRMA